MGISGRIAGLAQNNPITPIVAFLIILMGAIAILITPKEEDPQIDVTMVDVFVSAPGYSVTEVEQLVATKAENALAQVAGVEHVYSTSMMDRAIITIQFEVGIKRQEALVKAWNQVMTELHWPAQMGIQQPAVRARGINDVPIFTLTLWSERVTDSQSEIGQVAASVAQVLQQVKGTRNIELTGYAEQTLIIEVDPVKAAGYQLDVLAVQRALQSFAGSEPQLPVRSAQTQFSVTLGQPLSGVEDVERLVLKAMDNRIVYLRDIASVKLSAMPTKSYVQHGFGQASAQQGMYSAVTISVAKQEGQNAIDVANDLISTTESLDGRIIPEHIQYEISRNSGLTAQVKANTLIQKLLFATLAVVVLVLFALGRRAAVIVGIAVGLTLLITLFSSWAWGFTLNRISLFALIFSIGILVDDAIVVVENIHRRRQMHKDEKLSELIPKAVDEVGTSTILATFTVIAALVPMAFVSGLMGPYMSPIPVNASTGMLLSLIIAFTITPWLAVRLLQNEKVHGEEKPDWIGEWAARGLAKFITVPNAIANQWKLFIAIVLVMVAVMVLPATKLVLLKMLPFDNKSSFEVVVDMPEGTTAETTLSTLQALSEPLASHAMVTDFQLYAGVNAPIDFNGLVRQYYLRAAAHQGQINVNIVDNSERDIGSHQLAKDIRDLLKPIADRFEAKIKIVEQPSGPPTLAPLVAEVYGPDQSQRAKIARQLEQVLNQTEEVVDVDSSISALQPGWTWKVDHVRAAQLGITKQQVQQLLAMLLNEQASAYLQEQGRITPTPIIVHASDTFKADPNQWLNTKVANRQGQMVALSEFSEIISTDVSGPIFHKDMRPVDYVFADMAGQTDSPLYAMFTAQSDYDKQYPGQTWLFTAPPKLPISEAVKWDGEWQITFETFRDMGIAYSVGLLLIYLLILGQFKSYRLPLIIMAPIPLTVIGILPGHFLLDAKFTAPSMIGMIALAGIIVRNSILLVDFIEQQLEAGVALQIAVVESAKMRARPIILTALAAMIGAIFILPDPIFKGLAVSLIFGMALSSALTLFVIPIAYYRSAIKHMEK